ncbi:MAG: PIN domain-containing protein [Bacteroidales bacterium]|nr:PIN domain-containing protein [Bacteroidales bacterium]
MKYLLDTNIWIHLSRGRYGVDSRIREAGIGNCVISEISLLELLYGAECSDRKDSAMRWIDALQRNVAVIPIGGALRTFATQKARLRREGNMTDDFDLLIAATAMAGDYILVSENTRQFDRFNDLRIENWTRRDG